MCSLSTNAYRAIIVYLKNIIIIAEIMTPLATIEQSLYYSNQIVPMYFAMFSVTMFNITITLNCKVSAIASLRNFVGSVFMFIFYFIAINGMI